MAVRAYRHPASGKVPDVGNIDERPILPRLALAPGTRQGLRWQAS
jgi:hypothetical protein